MGICERCGARALRPDADDPADGACLSCGGRFYGIFTDPRRTSELARLAEYDASADRARFEARTDEEKEAASERMKSVWRKRRAREEAERLERERLAELERQADEAKKERQRGYSREWARRRRASMTPDERQEYLDRKNAWARADYRKRRSTPDGLKADRAMRTAKTRKQTERRIARLEASGELEAYRARQRTAATERMRRWRARKKAEQEVVQLGAAAD